ncbi:hypothetical protein [Calycomorphotria hydatis]|nr:hypothetical protein [Calycomorphotria hydatis]
MKTLLSSLLFLCLACVTVECCLAEGKTTRPDQMLNHRYEDFPVGSTVVIRKTESLNDEVKKETLYRLRVTEEGVMRDYLQADGETVKRSERKPINFSFFPVENQDFGHETLVVDGEEIRCRIHGALDETNTGSTADILFGDPDDEVQKDFQQVQIYLNPEWKKNSPVPFREMTVVRRNLAMPPDAVAAGVYYYHSNADGERGDDWYQAFVMQIDTLKASVTVGDSELVCTKETGSITAKTDGPQKTISITRYLSPKILGNVVWEVQSAEPQPGQKISMEERVVSFSTP